MPATADFRYTITARPRALLEVVVSGYLTAEQSAAYLEALERAIDAQLNTETPTVRLMFIDNLTGFQSVKVPRVHGVWFSQRGPSISRIAVVSSKASVSFGLAAVKLLTKHLIKAFNDPLDAKRWLEG